MAMHEIAGVLAQQREAVVVEEDSPPLLLEVFYWAHVHCVAIVTEIEGVCHSIRRSRRVVVGSIGGKGFFCLQVVASSLHFY